MNYLNTASYRLYDQDKVDALQRILFYRRCGLPLAEIKKLMREQSKVKQVGQLKQQYSVLKSQRENLDQLINTLANTIKYYGGALNMTNAEKFEALKKRNYVLLQKWNLQM